MKAWAVVNKRTGKVAIRSWGAGQLAIYLLQQEAVYDCARGQVPREVEIKVLPLKRKR